MKNRPADNAMGRRAFLAHGLRGTAAAAIGLAATRDRLLAADGGRNPFAYDVEKYQKTDPALVQYARVRQFKCPAAEPRRLAIGPEDRLYVAAGAKVSVVSREGQPVTEIDCGAPVRALGVAPDGTFFAGLKDRVQIHDAKGRKVASWEPAKGRPYLTGLAVGDNDVFAADSGNRLVWRYDRSGKLRGRIGEKDKDKEVPGLVLPSPFLDVEIGTDGLLRVNNTGRHRVEVYTFDGDLELAWGKPSMAIQGFCGCCNPVNLALLPGGRCVTFEKGLPRVKVYSADGAFECVVAGAESFANTSLAESIKSADDCNYGGLDGVVDSAGRVYVMDLLAADIQVFQHQGGPGGASS